MKAKTETENGFRETEIGLIPSDWDVGKLEDAADTFDKQRVPLSENARQKMKGDYPYCGANGVIDHINDYIFDGEYVLLAEDGGYWGKFDDSAYIMNGKFWVNNHAHILKAIENKAINKFLMYVLNYLDISIHISGTTRGKLTQGVMRNILLPLPSLPEQQKIALVLSKIQQAIKQQDKIIQITKELKKSLMNRLFTEGLRGEEQRETEIGLIPKSWEIIDVESCLSHKEIRVGKIKNQDFKQFGKYAIIDQGQSLIAGFSDDVAQVYQGDLPIIIFGDHTRILKFIDFPFICGADGTKVLLPKEGIYPKFLFYALSKLDIQSRGYNRHYRLLKEKEVPLPCIEEQKEIANILSNIEKKLTQAETRKQTLQAIFKTMLNQLMTGRVRVKNLDIEVN